MLVVYNKVYLSGFTVVLLKNDICRKGSVNLTKRNFNVKRGEIKDQNVSTEEDIVQKLGGKEMEPQELSANFLQDVDEKLELPIFKPDKVHPYYDSIRDLQILSNPKYEQRPFLLMSDLPTTDGDDGLTDTLIWKIVQR
ncbi:hypothetical protein C1646_767408 [Rhizophagus diaphanus]|nr:hypothetical protein C1646_767408 [Rhizophagus diaphanus] [Rhizophagus sp. MUCL 43196]